MFNFFKNNNLERFKKDLKKAVKSHFSTLANKQQFYYGYSLYTDGDVSSIGPVANKESGLEKYKSNSMFNYYKYNPDEWSDWDDFGLFDKANKSLKVYYEQVGEKNFSKYKNEVLNSLLDVFIELQIEGLFKKKNDKYFLVVWVSDSDNSIINLSAKKLNTEKVYEEYSSEFV